MLALVRKGRDVCWVEPEGEMEPLVTVAIPTFERPELIERAIASAQAQTYERLDILVVGDHTDSRSERLVRSVIDSDPRVRFVNLPRQGSYPSDARSRWLVSGTAPMNVALDLADGAWLVNCDDDDELLTTHVSAHLAFAKQERKEFVYSRWENVLPSDAGSGPSIGGRELLRSGSVARGAVLYSTGLAFMRYESECWRIRDPHDWNLWKRMQIAGVKIGFLPEVTYRYYH